MMKLRWTSRTTLFGTVLCLAGLMPASVEAVPQTFFGQDSNGNPNFRLPAFPLATAARTQFLANLTGVGTENFERFANGQGPPLNLTFPGAGNAQLTGIGAVRRQPTGTNGAGRYPTSAAQYYEVSGTFNINFSAPVAAFGFFGIDVGDFGGRLTLRLEGGPGGTQTLTVPNNTTRSADGSVMYFGVIDTDNPFTRVVFGNTAAGTDIFAFDDMTIGSRQQVQPVPEPASLTIAGLAAFGLLGYGLRRRRSS